MFDVFKSAALAAVFLGLSTPASIAEDRSGEPPSLAGVTLGMTYEEAHRALLDAGLRTPTSEEGYGKYQELFGFQVGELFTWPVQAGQERVKLQVGAILVYRDEKGRVVEILVVGTPEASFVGGIELTQRYEGTFPKHDQVVDKLTETYGFQTASCNVNEGQNLAFLFSAGSTETLPLSEMAPWVCFSNLEESITEFWFRPDRQADFDYALVFEAKPDRSVPDEYLGEFTVSLSDYKQVFAEIDRLANEAIEAQLEEEANSTPEVQF